MPERKRKAIVLSVTGGIACGKSEVGRILGEQGFAVCDSDRVAHDLMKKGTPVYRQVVDHFGERILSDTGEISRSALGTIVFEHPSERETLNQLVHPAVRDYLAEWIVSQRQGEQDAAVLIPLLFESGMETLDWNAVLCVSSSTERVRRRLKNRGLDPDEAEVRIRSQMPLAEKEQKADLMVPNSGTLEELEQATRKAVETVRAER